MVPRYALALGGPVSEPLTLADMQALRDAAIWVRRAKFRDADRFADAVDIAVAKVAKLVPRTPPSCDLPGCGDTAGCHACTIHPS